MNTSFQKNIAAIAHPLEKPEDLDKLIDFIGEAHFVLLGEASHGTYEYYEWRKEITKRLITEKNFSFIAVEGDWPDCYEINRFIKGNSKKESHLKKNNSRQKTLDTLKVFNRWPTWMWGNEEIADLIEWLYVHNKKLTEEKRIGFYGLDVYSLWESLESIINYLKEKDPEILKTALDAYYCFEPYNYSAQIYAYTNAFVDKSCEEEVIRLLTSLRRESKGYEDNREEYFNAEQNAIVLKNAEHYYRVMVHGDKETWNIRDFHMVETLERLMRFHGEGAKCIVWEHNSHIGDARATNMVDEGNINVGQLIRERHQEEGVALVGFGTYEGEVIAGESWEAPMQKMKVPPARKESWDDIFHRVSDKNKLFLFDEKGSLDEEWFKKRGQRAIGVVYHPLSEYGNYVPTLLPLRYDAFCFIDKTSALHPIPLKTIPEEMPETFPSTF